MMRCWRRLDRGHGGWARVWIVARLCPCRAEARRYESKFNDDEFVEKFYRSGMARCWRRLDRRHGSWGRDRMVARLRPCRAEARRYESRKEPSHDRQTLAQIRQTCAARPHGRVTYAPRTSTPDTAKYRLATVQSLQSCRPRHRAFHRRRNLRLLSALSCVSFPRGKPVSSRFTHPLEAGYIQSLHGAWHPRCMVFPYAGLLGDPSGTWDPSKVLHTCDPPPSARARSFRAPLRGWSANSRAIS